MIPIVADYMWIEVRRRIVHEFGEKDAGKMLESVKECINNRDHLTVFRVGAGSGSAAKDIDVAILEALLKGTRLGVLGELI